jgi:hypothetical protein
MCPFLMGRSSPPVDAQPLELGAILGQLGPALQLVGLDPGACPAPFRWTASL